jgi:DNA excision repair protein ERCC-3
VCRPTFIHEYKLTPYSLYAAASIGLETDDILKYLEQLSKIPISDRVKTLIRSVTDTYGKVRLVLKGKRYYIESSYVRELQRLLREPVIIDARVVHSTEPEKLAFEVAWVPLRVASLTIKAYLKRVNECFFPVG